MSTKSASIAEAAAHTRLSVHTLRYYEREGLLDRVPRDGGGQRRFADDDLARATFLHNMRRTGMPIRKLREYNELARRGGSTSSQRAVLLELHRLEVLSRMEELRIALAVIDEKIAYYRGDVECPCPRSSSASPL